MRSATVVIALICSWSPFVFAGCESVIALSKTVSTTSYDQEAVESNAANFCSEYAKGNTAVSGTSFGASYKFLSASYGNSTATTETVASKYCSSSNRSTASKSAFHEYLEAIAPGAFDAYTQCLKYSQSDLTFNVDAGSILPTQFVLSASFSSTVQASTTATLSASVSADISCQWDGDSPNGLIRKVETGTTASLDCRRTDQGKPGFVRIVRKDIGKSDPMVLRWPAYDKNGNKIDTVAIPTPAPPERVTVRVEASQMNNGGYMSKEITPGLLVATPGAASSNFDVPVSLPKAGTYRVTAMWAAPTGINGYVYRDRIPPPPSGSGCKVDMNDALLKFTSTASSGWDEASLPKYPDTIGYLLMPAGQSRVFFTTFSCNGGPLPTTRWVQFEEQP